MKKLLIIFLLYSVNSPIQAQTYQIALLKYNGGGDWYANLETSLPNLIQFSNQTLGTQINPEQAIVEVGSNEIYRYPFIHMTGHGNVVFSQQEVANLRKYLLSGGFLHIDDNYGLDKFIRTEMLKVFPELQWVELPTTHPIYHQKFNFLNGLPKVHMHDEQRPRGFGLIYEGRLVCFYSYESDLGDGWESTSVHNDSEESRLKALKMGANIIQYVLLGEGQIK
ncbi:DUF4159 domain-containing protein [bacterium SCSIO 12643]|nr:DUF4159 domain-containing protein [bacterium SCSIO 12643]